MNEFPINLLEEFKIKASILLKALRSVDANQACQAGLRFQRLPQLARLEPIDIVRQQHRIKRKHALEVIALEYHYENWADLKHDLDRQAERAALKSNRNYSRLYPLRCAGFLNEWYADYEVAVAQRRVSGGYLFPYQNQYFICQREYIKALGLDPDDPDWARIDWNWVKPAEMAAWSRLDGQLPD